MLDKRSSNLIPSSNDSHTRGLEKDMLVLMTILHMERRGDVNGQGHLTPLTTITSVMIGEWEGPLL